MPHPSFARGLLVAATVVAGASAWPARDCDVPAAAWQPQSAVKALAERNGWQIERLKIDDGCYEIRGRDADGRRFKAMIDPATLQVVRMLRRHGEPGADADRERERERDRDRDRDRDRGRDRARQGSHAPAASSPPASAVPPGAAPAPAASGAGA